MSAICGVVCLPVQGNTRAVEAMAAAIARKPFHTTSSGLSEGAVFGSAHPESFENLMRCSDGSMIAADSRLDNRAELKALLGFATTDTVSDVNILLSAYRRWGTECLDHLYGDYAFAIWDSRSRQLFCARDPFGVKTLFYYQNGNVFAFASEIKALLALDFIDRTPNGYWIADYFYNLVLDREYTLYANISRLEPGYLLQFANTTLSRRKYWRPDIRNEIRLANEEEYVEAFRDKLKCAVNHRITGAENVGAELSGGLDSSAICAVAVPELTRAGKKLHVYAHVRNLHDPKPRKPDGRAAVEMMCAHAGIDRCRFLTGVEHGVLNALEWANQYLDEPARVLVSLMNDSLHASAAEDGINVMLSGWAGNQGVTHEAAGLRVRMLRRLAARTFTPWRSRVETTTDPFWQRFPHLPLRDEVRERYGVRERTIQRNKLYTPRVGLVENVLHSLHLPNIAARIEVTAAVAAPRHIEYRYPLLDRRLIEFYLALPSRLKRRNGVGRYIFRRSVDPWLPEQITWGMARASANPGAPARRRRDIFTLRQRIDAIPTDSPVHEYVNVDKLSVSFDVGANEVTRPWDRTNDMLKVLMLDHRLRATI